MTDLRGHIWSDLLMGLNAGQHLTVDVVVAFVDGELGVSAQERAAAHLASCSSCAAEVTAQRQARSAVRSAAEPEVPGSLLAMLRSIPQTAEFAGAPEGLAVTSDGTIVSVAPDAPARLGSAALLGSAAPLGSTAPLATSGALGAGALKLPAGASRTGTARQGAGTVVSGLVLGALIMVTPGGAPVPTEPAPRAPVPAIPVADGSVPAVPALDAVPASDTSPGQLELHGVGVSDRSATGRSGLR